MVKLLFKYYGKLSSLSSSATIFLYTAMFTAHKLDSKKGQAFRYIVGLIIGLIILIILIFLANKTGGGITGLIDKLGEWF